MSDEFRIAAVSYRALHLKFLALENELTAAQERLTESAVQLAIARDEIVDLTEALTNKYALENEMAVMSDKLTCAMLEAKENAEIAPRREWVGLTGDEIEDLPKGGTLWEIIRAAEAILREKNNG